VERERGQAAVDVCDEVRRPGGAFGDVGLDEDGGFGSRLRGGKLGEQIEEREEQEGNKLARRAAQGEQSDRGAGHGEDEGEAPDAGEGGQAEWGVHIYTGVAEGQPGETEAAVSALKGNPEGGQAEDGAGAVDQKAGEECEHGQVQGLGGGEEREHGPTGGRGTAP